MRSLFFAILLILLIIVVAIILYLYLIHYSPSQQPETTKTAVAALPDCDQTLWDHVYHPARLRVIEECKIVTGTIVSIKAEKDGDLHIRLKPDEQFAGLLNQKNIEGQNGSLVLEPVCVDVVTQTDAADACKGFQNKVTIPKVGMHVEVTGSYVLDQEHGWNEIHPVTRIKPV